MPPELFNPTRLSLARRRRGLTKTALAQAVGVTTRTVIGYEKGEYEPTPEMLATISSELEFPPAFFFGPTLEEPPIDGVSFRAMSRLTAKLSDQARAAGTLAIALSDWIHARFKLREPSVPCYEGLDPESAAEAVRSEWELGEKRITNVIHLLEWHGVRVYSLSEETVQMDAFSFWRGDLPYVFLNTMKSGERSRMDAAHELGHLVMHSRGGAHGRQAENEARRFAAAFLMPKGSVTAHAPYGGSLPQLIEAKKRWNVSVASLAVRMHEPHIRMLNDWQYRNIFIEIGRNGYRTKEPDESQGETSQVLGKVFANLRDEGMSMAQVAQKLALWPQELSRLIFGLILTPILGTGTTGKSSPPPTLRLVR